MNAEAQFLIDRLHLEPHGEGGFFRRTYESKLQIDLPGYNGKRSVGTAIYYLIVGDTVDPFHRIKSDELWHFYSGSAFMLYTIEKQGHLNKISMGPDVRSGQSPQAVLESGTWLGAILDDPTSYALIGCTVSPGFDQQDFELAKREQLLREYPQYKSLIEKLTASE